jgi:hypothetical protein
MPATPTYRVARTGQPSREMTLDAINAALAAGELTAEDTWWREGQPGWQPIRVLPGVIFPRRGASVAAPAGGGPVAASAPLDPMAERAREAAGSIWGAATPYGHPVWWSAGAVIGASLVFTPLFGSILIWRNYRAAGQPSRGQLAVLWMWISALLLAGSIVAAALLGTGPRTWLIFAVGHLFQFTAWVLSCAWPHHRFQEQEIGTRRRPAGWGRPFALGGLGIAAWFGLVLLLGKWFA